MGTDAGRCVTFTVSQSRNVDVSILDHFDFITNQNSSHSVAPQVHRVVTLGEGGQKQTNKRNLKPNLFNRHRYSYRLGFSTRSPTGEQAAPSLLWPLGCSRNVVSVRAR